MCKCKQCSDVVCLYNCKLFPKERKVVGIKKEVKKKMNKDALQEKVKKVEGGKKWLYWKKGKRL